MTAKIHLEKKWASFSSLSILTVPSPFHPDIRIISLPWQRERGETLLSSRTPLSLHNGPCNQRRVIVTRRIPFPISLSPFWGLSSLFCIFLELQGPVQWCRGFVIVPGDRKSKAKAVTKKHLSNTLIRLLLLTATRVPLSLFLSFCLSLSTFLFLSLSVSISLSLFLSRLYLCVCVCVCVCMLFLPPSNSWHRWKSHHLEWLATECKTTWCSVNASSDDN